MRFVLACSLLALVACHKKPAAIAEPEAGIVMRNVPSDAAVPAPVPESGFSVVLTKKGPQDGGIKLARVARGPVMVVLPTVRVATIDDAGTAKTFDPYLALVGQSFGWGYDVGRIAGVWPNDVYIETTNFLGRGGTIFKNTKVDAEAGIAKVTGLDNAHIHSAVPWKDGSVLGWVANDRSFAFDMGKRPVMGELKVLSGPKPAVLPKLGSKQDTDGVIIAYPSGRIFMLGGPANPKTEDGSLDCDHVWDFPEGTTARLDNLPTRATTLAQGRTETETLAGGVGLSRFDGETWSKVATSFKSDIDDISVGEDGSVWIAAGGEVWRGAFPKLAFERVALPPEAGQGKLQVIARNADDVWIATTSVLLHNGKAKSITIADEPEIYQEAMLRSDPPPFTADCKAPFFVLGNEGEVEESAAVAFAATVPVELVTAATPVLGRIKRGRVVGVSGAIMHAAPDAKATNKLLAFFRTQRAKNPKLDFVCTMPTVEKELK